MHQCFWALYGYWASQPGPLVCAQGPLPTESLNHPNQTSDSPASTSGLQAYTSIQIEDAGDGLGAWCILNQCSTKRAASPACGLSSHHPRLHGALVFGNALVCTCAVGVIPSQSLHQHHMVCTCTVDIVPAQSVHQHHTVTFHVEPWRISSVKEPNAFCKVYLPILTFLPT